MAQYMNIYCFPQFLIFFFNTTLHTLLYRQRRTETTSSISFLDITSNLTSLVSYLSTKLYDKRNDSNFYPQLDSTMEFMYHNLYVILELACSMYSDCAQRHRSLCTKLLSQGFLRNRLILSFN